MAFDSSRLLRVVSWNVVDQALSALSNLGLSIAVARTTTASGFGAFAVAFLLFGISLAVTKSAVGQPLQMRLSGASAAERRRGFQAGLGAASVLGLAFGLLMSVAGMALGGEVGAAVVALAVVLPGLMLQDSCRMAAFTLGKPQLAAVMDAVWTAVQFGLLAILINNGQHQVGGLILAWGAAAALSALVGLAVLRTRPAPSRAWSWVREHRDLIRYLLPEYFLGLGAMQLGILLVGLMAGVTAVGSLRAAQVLLGPLGIVGAAVFQFAVPEVARRVSVSSRWLATLAAGLSGGLGVLTIGYVALLLLLPDAVGLVLFGDSWAGAAAVLLATGVSAVSSSLANGPAGVLYGLGQARATFRIYLAKGPVLILTLLAGTFLAGAEGAAWALAFVEAAVLPLWIVTLWRALGRLGSKSQGADPPVPVELPTTNTGDPGRKPTRTTQHLVYRSYGGENRKRRPHYYSKLLTLTSFVRAATRLPQADITFLNNGPVAADRLAIMQRFGRVVQLADEPLGLRSSYRAALLLSTTEPWSDDDVVSYVEDDYLFTEDAFLALAEAASELPQASYFTMYGDCPDYSDPEVTITYSLPRHWAPRPDLRTGGRVWFNRASITSTFSARVGVLRSDLPVFIACMRPFRKRYLDHETCLIYQGVVPYHGRQLLVGLAGDFVPSLRGVVRTVVLVPFRITLNLLARRHRAANLLYALTPNEATHLEHPVISPDQDWESVAIEVAQWATENGLAAPVTESARP